MDGSMITQVSAKHNPLAVISAGHNRSVVTDGVTFRLVTFRLEWKCTCCPHGEPVWFLGGYQPVCDHIRATGDAWLSGNELARQYHALDLAGSIDGEGAR